MISKSTLCAALAAAVLWPHPAIAQAPDDGKGRYALSPVEGGFLRLDKETGAVSLCAGKAQTWVCDAIEDRAKASGDAAKLEAENRELRERIKALEDQAAGGGAPLEPPAPKAQLPTEEEVDKALDYVENIFKKFRDRLRKYENAPPPSDGGGSNEPGKGGKQL